MVPSVLNPASSAALAQSTIVRPSVSGTVFGRPIPISTPYLRCCILSAIVGLSHPTTVVASRCWPGGYRCPWSGLAAGEQDDACDQRDDGGRGGHRPAVPPRPGLGPQAQDE